MLRRVCGIRPDPPKPPNKAEKKVPAPSPLRRRSLSATAIVSTSQSSSTMPAETIAWQSSKTFPASRVSSTDMAAIEIATGAMILSVAMVAGTAVKPANENFGRRVRPPLKTDAPAKSVRVLIGSLPTEAARVVTTTATSDEGTASVMSGRNLVIAALAAATPTAALRAPPERESKTSSWLLKRRRPRPLRKPFMMLSSTSSTRSPALNTAHAIWIPAASMTAGNM
mmetsp:Transcript_2107/g.4552  ORF Transcript_2107/g.4552 Transcript_2107/m.4552 type:complete len:226 (+) Transcript_2107:644-1321(+)